MAEGPGVRAMTDCSNCGNGVGLGYFTPADTDLELCRRHYNQWRREHGQEVATTMRPRHPDGEAIPGFERRRL